MRVLVTGGAGFIGSHVVDALLAHGLDVTVLDNLSPAAHSTEPDYLREDDARYHVTDIRDADAVNEALTGCDGVAHLASMVGLGVDLADLPGYVSNNDGGTATLLEGMRRTGFTGPMALASSMVVYGEGHYRCPEHGLVRPQPRSPEALDAGRFEPPCPTCGADLEPEAIPEGSPLEPRNVYAATKLHQEHLCEAWARETGESLFVFRYHNVYGPRMPRNTPYAGVASIFRSALADGRAPQVYEDGGQIRDFVHVRDVAAATITPFLEPSAPTGAYNVASGTPHTIGEMAFALAAAFGNDSPPPVVTGDYRLGDVRHVFASVERSREVLGLRAEVGFEEGMRAFAEAPLRLPPEGGRG
jgi:dTDP-L-rhamnose 4-epimerase